MRRHACPLTLSLIHWVHKHIIWTRKFHSRMESTLETRWKSKITRKINISNSDNNIDMFMNLNTYIQLLMQNIIFVVWIGFCIYIFRVYFLWCSWSQIQYKSSMSVTSMSLLLALYLLQRWKTGNYPIIIDIKRPSCERTSVFRCHTGKWSSGE